MNNSDKIKKALAYKKKTAYWLAGEIGTTPPAFSQRMKTGKFTTEELDRIASVLGAVYTVFFEFPDGTKI